MAQLLIRNLEAHIKVRLERRAKCRGRSMEEEAKEILRNALREEDTPATGLGTAIAALFSPLGLQEDIPEQIAPRIATRHASPKNRLV